jgi:hypothetical protein
LEYAKRRRHLQLSEEWINFIGSHAARIHFTDGQIIFDDPADFKKSNELAAQFQVDDNSQREGGPQ